MWPTTLFSLGLFEKLPCPLQTADMRGRSQRPESKAKTRMKIQSLQWIVEAYQSWPRTKSAQNMVPCAAQ